MKRAREEDDETSISCLSRGEEENACSNNYLDPQYNFVSWHIGMEHQPFFSHGTHMPTFLNTRSSTFCSRSLLSLIGCGLAELSLHVSQAVRQRQLAELRPAYLSTGPNYHLPTFNTRCRSKKKKKMRKRRTDAACHRARPCAAAQHGTFSPPVHFSLCSHTLA